MFRNFIEDSEEFERLERRGSFWRCAAAISAVVAALAAICALVTKLQNLKYKEKLIELSERFPNTPEQEAELEEIRKREWAAAHSPSNRRTTEERLAENRVTEEM